jgi:hypothetical protein
MSGKYSSVSRRLAKFEQKLADRARREKLANCICGGTIIAVSVAPELFEGEMNRTCPVHGFRRFGELHIVNFGRVDPAEEAEGCGPRTDEIDKEQDNNLAKLNQLLEMYELREWEYLKSRNEIEEHES